MPVGVSSDTTLSGRICECTLRNMPPKAGKADIKPLHRLILQRHQLSVISSVQHFNK